MKKILMLLLGAFPLFAGELNSGDTAFMLLSTALVVFMAPVGLALFYSGMTKSKHIVNSFFLVFIAFFSAMIAWVIAGYSIAFDTGNSIVGGMKYFMLSNISFKDLTSDAQLYPKLVFVLFQGAFAGITVAIIAGSVIERIKFSTWIVFSFLWTLIVYAPLAHMVWGGGYLFNLGTLDFAGGTVVHMSGGLAGLILAIMLGRRIESYKGLEKPSSVIFTAVGAGLLLLGWFGFNGGSAFGSSTIAGLAYITTVIAAAVGVFSWLFLEKTIYGKISIIGASSGLISGLVAITPAAGFVSVSGAMIIGLVGSLIAFFGVSMLKEKFEYDDSLDAFGIHFLAGLWGAIATGIFALNDKTLLWDGPLKASGDRLSQIIVQFEAVGIAVLFVLVGSVIVYYISSFLTKGARVDEENEIVGLDFSLHKEKGFDF